MTTPAVFVSYAHKDEVWKDRLVSQLRVLEKDGLLEVWEDRLIEAGESWNDEISEAMSRASVAVLLVSVHSLSSAYVTTDEIPWLRKRREQNGLRIVPVVVSPCPWNEVQWLRQLQLRPRDGVPLTTFGAADADAQLASIAGEIAAMVRGGNIAPRPGHHVPIPPRKVFTSRLPATDGVLIGRDAELEALDAAWDNPDVNVLSIVAWGGVGKSALMNKWVARMALDQFRGAELVYAWSFYLQGTQDQLSADDFITDALQWFGDPDPSGGLEWQKGVRLARLVTATRTLMLLDGLEPLQQPSGPDAGFVRDQALKAFLRELAANNHGLCIISSRLEISDLRAFRDTTVHQWNLESLSADAGAELLRARGVRGDWTELQEASEEYGGHGLALTLLATYLRDFHNGNVAARDQMQQFKEDERQGGHARRVMESYERQLDDGSISVLSMVALFDRPARREQLAALCEPPIAGLKANVRSANWPQLVQSLRRSGLLSPAREGRELEELDAHPLVREYFSERLRREGAQTWVDANARLYEYFRDVAPKLPVTLTEMDPLLRAVTFGCRAGRHRDVLHEVLLPRIMRGEERYAINTLGANGAVLAALAQFFEGGDWRAPVSALTTEDCFRLLELACPALLVTKGWIASELIAASEKARAIAEELNDPEMMFQVLSGLWTCYSVGGKLHQARELALELVQRAEDADSATFRLEAYAARGHAEFWLGNFPESIQSLETSFASYGAATHRDAHTKLYGEDPAATYACYKPVALGMIGLPEQGEHLLGEVLQFRERFRGTFSEALILCGAAWFYAQVQDVEKLEHYATELGDLAAKQEFLPWAVLVRVMNGWVATMKGRLKDGIAEMTAGRTARIELGGGVTSVYFATLLADACTRAKRLDEAEGWLDSAIEAGATEGYYLPEAHRIRAEWLHASGAREREIVASLEESVRVAKKQGALLLELRSAVSWCRLTGNRAVLRETLDRFTEGFETPDLIAARNALRERE